MKGRIPRIITRVIVFLLLGAIVNVAVAWGCALWTPVLTGKVPRPSTSHFQYRTAFGYTQRDWVYVVTGYRAGADGKPDLSRPSPSWGSIPTVVSAGWPARSLTGSFRLEAPKFRGDLPVPCQTLPKGWLRAGVREQIPVEPILPGFAINTLFYAAILWAMFAAPLALRRRRRLKCGMCPACAYPRGESDVCTECGKLLEYKDATT